MDYVAHGAQPLWPLEKLETYPLFSRFEPAWAYDPTAADVVADRQLLKFTTIQEMAANADALCRVHMGQQPPCQVSLFLYQFPDNGFEDCIYAHWAMMADKALGPSHCAAAISIEPVEFPHDGPAIQRNGVARMIQHPWTGLTQRYAVGCLKSAKVRWVSDEAHAALMAYVRHHHPHHEAALAGDRTVERP